MIQNRLKDKDKDIRGLKKQTSSLLNCAWEKGYVAGFDDGYKSGRQAEERPKGKWIAQDEFGACFKCSNCGIGIDNDFPVYRSYCPNCGADMRGDV